MGVDVSKSKKEGNICSMIIFVYEDIHMDAWIFSGKTDKELIIMSV